MKRMIQGSIDWDNKVLRCARSADQELASLLQILDRASKSGNDFSELFIPEDVGDIEKVRKFLDYFCSLIEQYMEKGMPIPE